MRRLLFILPIAVVILAIGCEKTEKIEQTEPVEIVLDHHKLLLLSVEESQAPGVKVILYSDITPEGFNDTIRILQGNGGYRVTKTYETTDTGPKIKTEARVVGDSIVIITMKGDVPEYTQPNEVYFACFDDFLLTDSENMEHTISATSWYIGGL